VETVKAGLIRFYREIAGVGLVFPRADRPIAVEWVGYQVIRLHPIEGIEFVEEAVTVCRAFGWEIEAHRFKVATAAGLVAIWHNSRITVDRGQEEVSGAGHARSVAAS
jgi:preprotein translocase subunit Sec61beta